MGPQVFALIVGVDEYIHSAIPKLSGCVKDAGDFRKALLLRYPRALCHLLTNQNATRAKILDDFRTHLSDNPRIFPNDIMVVYFAGYGQRYTAQRREVDTLIPFDYGLDVPGISDATLHELLQGLVDKKGLNVSNTVTAVRRIQDPFWPAHNDLTMPCNAADSPEYLGFFTDTPRYVFLGASSKYGQCRDSPNGGLFTQALASSFESSWPPTCRELTVRIQQVLDSESPRVSMPVCHGQQLDRILFSVPRLRSVQKLRVSLCGVELRPGLEHVSVVSRRQAAEVVVCKANDGRATLEHRKGLVSRHGRSRLSIEEADLPQILTGFACFNDSLNLRPAKTSWARKLWARLRRMFGWGTKPLLRSSVEMYHYKEDRARRSVGEISQNILQDGVANLGNVPNDHVFGMKITNSSDEPVYPYLVHFDSSTYAVKVLYSPFPKDGRGPPKQIQPEASLIFGHAPNETSTWGNGPSLRVNPDESTERTAEVLKIILSKKPIDLGYMAQPSPMLAPRERAVPEVIPGVWTEETVVLEVPANHFH